MLLDINTIGHKKSVWIALEADENYKILRIRDIVKKYEHKDNQINKIIDVRINSIGISLIASYMGIKNEIIYGILKTISFSMIKEESKRKMWLTVKDIQVDNQMKKEPLFPVMILKNQDEKFTDQFFSIYTISNLLIDPK